MSLKELFPAPRARWAIPGWLPDTRRKLAFVLCIVVGAQSLIQLPSHTALTMISSAALYIIGLLTIFLARSYVDRRIIVTGAVFTLGVSCALILSSSSTLGVLLIYILAFFLVYQLPRSWSLPLVAVLVVGFAGVLLIYMALVANTASAPVTFWSSRVWSDWGARVWNDLWVLPLLAVLANAQRSRAEILQQLQIAQEQLRAEMARTAELATTAERMRIARDMHDVLAHSLTMLAVQTQATREIVLRQPERAAQMLDVMVQVVSESSAESRRAIGALRETPQTGSGSSLGEQLRSLAQRFALRTGMTCTLTETGVHRVINETQTAALLYALQEALTNAHRHGAARRVCSELVWRQMEVILTVRDDGNAPDTPQTPTSCSGNGLRGMRERVVELGGSVSAAPDIAGGFVVRVTVPFGALARVSG